MAHYLVQAKPMTQKLKNLKERLESEAIRKLRPFGNTLHYSLTNARLLPGDIAVWEEEDYCSPPLAQERAAVLDHFFREIRVKLVSEGAGWKEIEELPKLWDRFTF